MKRLSARKFAALRRAYGTATVAARLGVHPSTVRRWKGAPPERYYAALRSLEQLPKPPTKRATSRLLKRTTVELSTLFGVSKATARRWQRAGQIPARTLARWSRLETAPKGKRLTEREAESYKGRYTRGKVYTLDAKVGSQLDDEFIAEFLGWLSDKEHEKGFRSKHRTFQATVTVSTSLGVDERKPGGGYLMVIRSRSKDDQDTIQEFAIPTRAWSSLSVMIDEMSVLLHENIHTGLTVISASLFVRRPVEVIR